MSENGKVVVTDEQLAKEQETIDQSKEILKDWTLVAQEDPVTPVERYQHKRAGRNWRLYKSIDWEEWWQEFNTAVNGKGEANAGKRKYKSVWHFICKKTKVFWQRQAIWEMIGPEPKKDSKGKLESPWLGNWEQRRRNEFYVFDDTSKVLAVEHAIKERKESAEAIRALAPMVCRRLAYWYKIRDKITEAFAGVDWSNESKTGRFLRWQEKVESIINELEQQYMRVFGVNPLDPAQQLVNLAGTIGKVGAAAALTGAVAAGAQLPGRSFLAEDGTQMALPDNVSYDSILFAQHLKDHANTYNIPVPIEKLAKQKVKTQ